MCQEEGRGPMKASISFCLFFLIFGTGNEDDKITPHRDSQPIGTRADRTCCDTFQVVAGICLGPTAKTTRYIRHSIYTHTPNRQSLEGHFMFCYSRTKFIIKRFGVDNWVE